MFAEFAWLVPLLPVAAFLVIGTLGWRRPSGLGPIAVALCGLSLAAATGILYEAATTHDFEPYEVTGGWVESASFRFEMGFLVDPLSALMGFIVGLVGFLVVLYSAGYMKGEKGLGRYYAEITLFIGVMQGLVFSSNFLEMFIFWELVGLCSYLLIGFWYRKPSAASAAKKAFLVTRIGDVFFMVGLIYIYQTFHTFNFLALADAMKGTFDHGSVTVISLLLFGGAMGKSAQFPLHVWLPDAMEGPTTVSALIHAATMVKAGIYLIARAYFFFSESPLGLETVAWFGGFTAFLAATMALVANDIKRVIAYSTISQLGLMALALGTGLPGYTPALFHLMNHAFFKALLFLGAGSVIHAIGTNDMTKMGGLFPHMRLTAVAMLIGSLAVSGIPPFSGFWSKDEIMAAVYSTGHYPLFAMAAAASLLTAFYTFRMWFMTFTGAPRWEKGAHPHESPPVMTVPLMILSALAVGSGLGGLYLGFGEFIRFGEAHEGGLDIVVVAISTAVALLGTVTAYYIYNIRRGEPAAAVVASPTGKAVHTFLSEKWYFDHIYLYLAKKIFAALAVVSDRFDRKVVDGAVNGIASASTGFGSILRRVQTGQVRYYAAYIAFGIALLLVLFIAMPTLQAALGGAMGGGR